jgi:hypothetical protein
MKDDQFTKLFKYIQNELKAINLRLDNTATKEQVDNLLGAVSELSGDIKGYH